MKLTGIPIGSASLKDGKITIVHKLPKSRKIARRAKAERELKAWMEKRRP